MDIIDHSRQLSVTPEKNNPNKVISIIDIESHPKEKLKLDSPKSIIAMKTLGYTSNDLIYFTFKEYLAKNPEYNGQDRKGLENRYEYAEAVRMLRIKEIKELRESQIENDLLQKNKRINSLNKSKISCDRDRIMLPPNTTYNSPMQLMPPKHDVDLVNMVQIELTKEILKLNIEEKELQQRERREQYAREQYERRMMIECTEREEEQNFEARKREIEMRIKQKEIEKKNKEEIRAMEEAKKAQDRIQRAMMKQQQDEKKREEIQLKHNEIIHQDNTKIQHKINILEDYDQRKKQNLENKKQMQFWEKYEKEQNKREKNKYLLQNLHEQRHDYCSHLMNKKLIKEIKWKNYEQIRLDYFRKKEDDFRKRFEDNKNTQEILNQDHEKKVDNYLAKHRFFDERYTVISSNKQQEHEMKCQMNREKEDKAKKLQYNLSMADNDYKEKLTMKMYVKEKDIEELRKEKELINQRYINDHSVKRAEIEERIYRVAMNDYYKRDGRLNQMKNKEVKLEEKENDKIIQTQQKQLENYHIDLDRKSKHDLLELIFQQQELDNRAIRTIREIFPENYKINNLLDHYQKSCCNLNSRRSKSYTKNNCNESTTSLLSDKSPMHRYSSFAHSLQYNNHMKMNLTKINTSRSTMKVNHNLMNKSEKRSMSYASKFSHSGNSELFTNYQNATKNDYNANSEEIINQQIEDYRLELTKEMMILITEEKNKEARREVALEEAKNNPESYNDVVKRIDDERLKSQELIERKNIEIEKKIKEYEKKLNPSQKHYILI